MDIYFLRHGIAEDQAATDFDRRLTEEGRAKCVEEARGIKALGLTFSHVWTSPLVRSRETAELVVPDQAAEVHDVLANEPPTKLIEELARLPRNASVLLVGHEPQMSCTIEQLLKINLGQGQIKMRKGGLALVVTEPRNWPQTPTVLEFLLTPKQLRLMGGVGGDD